MKALFTTFFIITIVFSCSKSPKCWGDDKNKGIIENAVRIVCAPITDQQEFHITDEAIFEEVFTNPQTGELICTLPSIDFNQSALLGLFTTGSCKVKHVREVTRDESNQKYHYKVIVKSCGTCKKESRSFNWVTVPKLPDDWTVTFEVDYK